MATKSHATSRLVGFTLIELLVVVAIIGVLAGLLLPVMGVLRTQATTLTCMNNQRQIGMAAAAYSIDNRGLFVVAYDDAIPDMNKWWYGKLKNLLLDDEVQSGETVDKIFKCPAIREKVVWKTDNTVTYSKNIWTGEKANAAQTSYPAIRMASVRSPSETFWLADASRWDNSAVEFHTDAHIWISYVFNIHYDDATCGIGFRHNRKAVFLYMDGRVGTLSYTVGPDWSDWLASPPNPNFFGNDANRFWRP
jgi:prepilin-type N-terminal cleavage/methylation domain-containing protein/prepilin-type processing-associated H-X9-DG protein